MKVTLCLESAGRFVMAIVMAAGLSAGAKAQTILFDLGNADSFRGVSVTNPDSNGNYWNSVWAGAFYPSVVDIDGNATAVNFGFSADGGNDSYNGPAGATDVPPLSSHVPNTDIDAAALGNLGVQEAAFDFYVSSKFQIQGLDPAKTYDLTLFGSHKFNNDNTTRYTVYTDDTFTTPVASADLLVGVDGNHNRDTVATISGVAPQTGNILYVGFAGANGGSGYLNALQLTAVPEPSALLLLMSGAVLACGFRRR
jgi:PEP-CTERM motif